MTSGEIGRLQLMHILPVPLPTQIFVIDRSRDRSSARISVDIAGRVVNHRHGFEVNGPS